MDGAYNPPVALLSQAQNQQGHAIFSIFARLLRPTLHQSHS